MEGNEIPEIGHPTAELDLEVMRLRREADEKKSRVEYLERLLGKMQSVADSQNQAIDSQRRVLTRQKWLTRLWALAALAELLATVAYALSR